MQPQRHQPKILSRTDALQFGEVGTYNNLPVEWIHLFSHEKRHLEVQFLWVKLLYSVHQSGRGYAVYVVYYNQRAM